MKTDGCPWCKGLEVIPPHPESDLCVRHLHEFAQMFPDRTARRRKGKDKG